MDFDDLEAEAERRTAAGEKVLGHVVENHQPVKGTVLPLVTRSPAVPSAEHLPEVLRLLLPPKNGLALPERRPVLRLICCFGAADSYAQEWCLWEHEAPAEVEVLTYETRGHGVRSEEALLGSLSDVADDAFEALREILDSGHFALLGHSIGCLIATAVAERARRELGVEPLAVFMLERGPPHLPAISDFANELVRSDAQSFIEGWDPRIGRISGQDTAQGRKARALWSNDMRLEADTRPVGWHLFTCPIWCFIAMQGSAEDWRDSTTLVATAVRDDPLFDPARHLQLRPRRCRANGMVFLGHFTIDECKQWSLWTEHLAGCRLVEATGTNHFSIKSDATVRETIWGALREIFRKF